MEENEKKVISEEILEVTPVEGETKKKFEIPKAVKTGLKVAGVATVGILGFILGKRAGYNQQEDNLEVHDYNITDPSDEN